MTLQYGRHDCFHSKVPFGGRYIPFGTHRESYLNKEKENIQCLSGVLTADKNKIVNYFRVYSTGVKSIHIHYSGRSIDTRV